MNQSIRVLNPGKASSKSGSSVSTANSGIKPTIDLARSVFVEPSVIFKPIVEEPVLLVPQPRRRPAVFIAVAIYRKCSKNLLAMSSYTMFVRRQFDRDRSMFRQYIAIQLVPSACSIMPPLGSGLLRSNTPILSSPRNPPSKMLLPFGVLAIHPPGEIHQQLMEHASPGMRSRLCPSASRRSGKQRQQAQACTGGFTSPNCPLVRGHLPVGMHVPFAQRTMSAAPWRNPDRLARTGSCGTPGPRPRTTGTPTCPASRCTSSLYRCAPSRLSRPCQRAPAGGGGWPDRPSASPPPRSDKTACDHNSPAKPGAGRFSRLPTDWRAEGIELVGLLNPLSENSIEVGHQAGCIRLRGEAQAQHVRFCPALSPIRTSRTPWCRCPRDSRHLVCHVRCGRGRRPCSASIRFGSPRIVRCSCRFR